MSLTAAPTQQDRPAATRTRRAGHPLLRYILARLGISVLLVWGVTLITFILTNLVPADPVKAVLGDAASNDPRIVKATRHAMGLDRPLPVQYLIYLKRLMHGDLGTSAQTHNPVTKDLATAFPATIELALAVLVLSILIGIGLGLYAALRHRKFSDQLIRVLSLVGISMPTFWLAMVFFYVFFYLLGWAPGSGQLDPTFSTPPHVTGMYVVDALIAGQWDTFGNALAHLILPTIVLTLYTVGLLVRFSRSSILDVINQDYVTAARAKGLSGRTVTFRYILRGALLPILTMVGLTFGSLLSGSVLTETVFSWHGLGQYAYEAATSLDLQAIMGVGVTVGVVFISINFIVDLLYGLIDPRVRVK